MRLLSIITFLLLLNRSQGQQTRETVTDRLNGVTEKFNVLISDNTVKEGHYACYYNNIILHEGEYRNNQKSGEWTYYDYETGKPSFVYDHTKSNFTGAYNCYSQNKVSYSCNYVNGVREGVQKQYNEDGTLIEEATYINGMLEGLQKNYSKSGQIKRETNYAGGQKNGIEIQYHQNGTVLSKAEYKGGKLVRFFSLSDTTGKALDIGTLKDGSGTLKDYLPDGTLHSITEYSAGIVTGKYTEYRADGSLFIEGWHDNHRYSGIWTFYLKNGKAYSVYDFDKKTVLREDSAADNIIDPNERRRILAIENRQDRFAQAVPTGYNTPETLLSSGVMRVVEQEAKFPGGKQGLIDYLTKNIFYPPYAKKKRIQGRVIVGFTIDIFGEVTDVSILRSVNPDLDREALRVVSMMPRWDPGLMIGVPVRVNCNVPIAFKLN